MSSFVKIYEGNIVNLGCVLTQVSCNSVIEYCTPCNYQLVLVQCYEDREFTV